MTWDRLPEPSTFEKARRREAYRKLARIVRGRSPRAQELLPLEDVKQKLRLFDQAYVGIRPIPVSKIVGTTDRSRDFDRDFLPLRTDIRERWNKVEHAFPQGEFPPIVVYKVGEVFFVVDGHHRVAIAKQHGIEQIDAEITEIHTPVPLGPEVDVARLIHSVQEQLFLDESGLARARPEARIEFSRPTGYVELLELVKAHGYHVMVDRQAVVPIDEIAADWYDWVYMTATQAIAQEGLREVFPDATDGDLFLWIWQRRRALFPERGGISIEDAARLTRDEVASGRVRMSSMARGAVGRLTSKKRAGVSDIGGPSQG